jgi:hypothetical protein
MAVSLYLQRIELKITKHKKVKISDSGSEESRFEPWQDNVVNLSMQGYDLSSYSCFYF